MQGVFTNHNAYSSPKIIDKGPKKQVFKIITIYQQTHYTAIDYLRIKNLLKTCKSRLLLDQAYATRMDGLAYY